MPDRAAMERYLEKVSEEATDHPRALAAGILVEALRRPVDAPPVQRFVEEQVRTVSLSDSDTAAEVMYELGSLLVELRDLFPDLPLHLASNEES